MIMFHPSSGKAPQRAWVALRCIASAWSPGWIMAASEGLSGIDLSGLGSETEWKVPWCSTRVKLVMIFMDFAQKLTID